MGKEKVPSYQASVPLEETKNLELGTWNEAGNKDIEHPLKLIVTDLPPSSKF